MTSKASFWGLSMNKIFLAIWAGLILACCARSSAQPKIERLQRDFQARYKFLAESYVGWPACGCSQTPSWPKDGYYGDIAKDPLKGVELVRDMVEKFHHLPIKGRPFYKNFVETESGLIECETINDVPRYAFNVVLSENVNAGNYLEILGEMVTHMTNLQWVLIDGGGNIWRSPVPTRGEQSLGSHWWRDATKEGGQLLYANL